MKNVPAAKTSNYDEKCEGSAESTVITKDFSPENVTVDHESSPKSQVFQPLIEEEDLKRRNLICRYRPKFVRTMRIPLKVCS